MKITELFKNKMVMSYEVFPPKPWYCSDVDGKSNLQQQDFGMPTVEKPLSAAKRLTAAAKQRL